MKRGKEKTYLFRGNARREKKNGPGGMGRVSGRRVYVTARKGATGSSKKKKGILIAKKDEGGRETSRKNKPPSVISAGNRAGAWGGFLRQGKVEGE